MENYGDPVIYPWYANCCEWDETDLECNWVTPARQHCDETLSGTSNEGYRGCQSRTRSGKLCQKWTHNEPQDKDWEISTRPNKGLDAHNLCRNPLADDPLLDDIKSLYVDTTPIRDTENSRC